MVFLKGDTRGWDRIIIIVSTILFVPYLLLPGFDAVRYQWSSVPRPVAVAGFADVIVSLLLFFAVLRENAYLSRFVEIQREKGHRVVTSGPYRYVRHPMYVGLIILLYSLPVALGSLWTLIPASVLILVFVIRTYLEDKTLRRELDGYEAYSAKVRYRLLPGDLVDSFMEQSIEEARVGVAALFLEDPTLQNIPWQDVLPACQSLHLWVQLSLSASSGLSQVF